MGKVVQFSAHLRPSGMVRNMRRHGGDVSEGDKPKLLAQRLILGKRCRFYSNGEHTVDNVDVSAEESHDSVLLKFAHASILISQPVGDKKVLWVDATKNPCEVWIHNRRIEEFLEIGKLAIRTGAIGVELVVDDNPIPKIKEIIDKPKHIDDRRRMAEKANSTNQKGPRQ